MYINWFHWSLTCSAGVLAFAWAFVWQDARLGDRQREDTSALSAEIRKLDSELFSLKLKMKH